MGERIVLYVLNRIIYRTVEMGSNEVPFLCHGEDVFAKILWKNGEAVGFYSVKSKGQSFAGESGSARCIAHSAQCMSKFTS